MKNRFPTIGVLTVLALFIGAAPALAAELTVPATANTDITEHYSLGGIDSVHGSDATFWAIGAPGYVSTPLVEFGLSQYAGYQVAGNATFEFFVNSNWYLHNGYSGTCTQVITANQELTEWNPATSSWANLPGPYGSIGAALDTETVTFGGALGARYVSWSIPGSVVQSWINEPTDNYGLALVSSTTPDFEDLFFSSLSGGDAPLLVFSASPVPEPGTASLLAAAFLGAGGFGLLRRLRCRRGKTGACR